MNGVADQPAELIRQAHNYGRFTFDLTLGGSRFVRASEEELQQVIKFARRRIQNRVVPAVERLVEEQGVQIGKDAGEHAHVKKDLEAYTADASVSAHADCEIVGPITRRTESRIEEVVELELLTPLDDFVALGMRDIEDYETFVMRLARMTYNMLRSLAGR